MQDKPKKSKLQGLVVFLFFIIAVIFIAISYYNQNNNFWLTIAGGVAATAIMAFVQYLVSMAEYKEINEAYEELYKRKKELEEFKKMGVKRVLPARDDPETYGTVIKNSQDRIWVMGNTAYRLLEDFANKDGSTWYKDVLLKFLDKGGEVKILVAEKRYLFKEKDKKKFDLAKKTLQELNEIYKNFSFAYFKHIPAHSIFVFDDNCLLGPIFDNLESKSTPVLEMDTNSEYAQKYLNYFNHQWDEATKVNV
jgi:DNA-directed RNA polymerase beta' subunit